jgi:hypothetical protein
MTTTTEHPIQATLLRASARAWGIATGLVLGIGTFAATLWLVIKGGEDAGTHLRRLSNIFPGYDVTVGGAVLGFFYAFVVGYALGRLLAPRQPLTIAERQAEREKHLRLNGTSWGAAIGAVLAVVLASTTLALVARDSDAPGQMLRHLSLYFPGFSVSVSGAFLGAFWAFALGFALGKLIALVYNAAVVRAEEDVAQA